MVHRSKAEVLATTASMRPSVPDASLELRPPAATAYTMRARGTIFVGFRQAVLDIFGQDGLQALSALLPVDVRYDTIDTLLVSSEWLPEAHVMAWYEALWTGPCQRQRAQFALVLDRMMDFGFGRIRKALLGLADPSFVIAKATTLWRYDHTHGDLTAEHDDSSVRLRLENHPYTENPLSCLATAEIYRYCAALCRVRNVVASHYREPSGALIVRLRWER
jgi:hypothetical protein